MAYRHKKHKKRLSNIIHFLTTRRWLRYGYGLAMFGLLVGYLAQVNATATAGVKMNSLDQKRSEVSEQVRELEAKLLSLRDPAAIVAAASNLNLTAALSTHQITPSAGLAFGR